MPRNRHIVEPIITSCVAIVVIVSFFNALPVMAQSMAQSSSARVTLPFMGVDGRPLVGWAEITYERRPESEEPIIDWSATFVYINRRIASGFGGGRFRVPGRLEIGGEYGQLFGRAAEHAKQLRDRSLPAGRFGINFEFLEGLPVKDPQDLEAAIAVAFLALQDGRSTEPDTILGGLDSQGRLRPVAELNKRLTVIVNLGARKIIIPSGQSDEISGELHQTLYAKYITVTEAATLKDVYDLVAKYPGVR